jgi:hypothetical protein
MTPAKSRRDTSISPSSLRFVCSNISHTDFGGFSERWATWLFLIGRYTVQWYFECSSKDFPSAAKV